MDILTINCPNCGGVVQRRRDEYFVRCPYCGSEVAFDEIKEEAQLEGYRAHINYLEQNENADRTSREAMVRWMRARNIVLAAMTLLYLIGFCVVGYDSEMDRDGEMWIGVPMMLISLGMYFFGVPTLAAAYPAYDALSKKTDKAGKVKMWIKLGLTGLGLFCVASILAYIIIRKILKV